MDSDIVKEVREVAQADLESASEALTQGVGSGLNRVVVDWDGTCIEADTWPEMGDWLEGAASGLRMLLGRGYEVVIFSTRLAPCQVDEVTPRPEQKAEIQLIRKMLDEQGLFNVDIWLKPWKPGALAYLDDKAIRINPEKSLQSWSDALWQLRRPRATSE